MFLSIEYAIVFQQLASLYSRFYIIIKLFFIGIDSERAKTY